LIRCFAIFAELSFAGLITKSLLRMNEEVPELIDTNNKLTTFLQTKTLVVLFVCIFIANIFATSATITKIDLLFALEETCWGSGSYPLSRCSSSVYKSYPRFEIRLNGTICGNSGSRLS
jgi:hypothetical protein